LELKAQSAIFATKTADHDPPYGSGPSLNQKGGIIVIVVDCADESKPRRKFIFHTISQGMTEEGSGNKIAFVGDAEVVKAAKRRLVALTFARYGYFKKMPFDMEPFEVLRDMLRSNQYSSIGGAPQLVKIYEHMNATPFGV
jgi:hypothetical protein